MILVLLLVLLVLFYYYKPLNFAVKPYTAEVYKLSVPLLEKNMTYSTFKKSIPKLDSVVHRDMVNLYKGGNFTVEALDRLFSN
jgi:hypothetical protein